MKVDLRSVFAEKPDATHIENIVTVDLPGCLVSNSGHPLIVAIDSGWTGGVSRIWYLTAVDIPGVEYTDYSMDAFRNSDSTNEEEVVKNEEMEDLAKFDPKDLNELAGIINDVTGFTALSKRYEIAKRIMQAGFKRN